MDGQSATMVERMNDRLARSDLSSRMHRLAYRLSNGLMGSRIDGVPVLLLTTVGRKTGRSRTVPLMYLPDGERMLVVASNAASPDRPPGWWFNIQSDRHALVQVGGDRFGVLAHELDDADRDGWWPQLAELNPKWERFQAETDRRFPVVVLQPDRSATR